MNSTDGEDWVKSVLAWGSLSYACGFVTVTAHTWRLGLPVIQLIEPIYVWIGLPVAVVAFFSKKLYLYFRVRGSSVAEQLRTSSQLLAGRQNPAPSVPTCDDSIVSFGQAQAGEFLVMSWPVDQRPEI
jgi:hypothetical protein